MHLARLIELWQSKLQPQGVTKEQAAAEAVADLMDYEVFSLLPVISELDPWVAKTDSGWRNLSDHARMCIEYWLCRTDTHQLTELRDQSRDNIHQRLYGARVGQQAILAQLTTQELGELEIVKTQSDQISRIAHRSLAEITRLRAELATTLRTPPS